MLAFHNSTDHPFAEQRDDWNEEAEIQFVLEEERRLDTNDEPQEDERMKHHVARLKQTWTWNKENCHARHFQRRYAVLLVLELLIHPVKSLMTSVEEYMMEEEVKKEEEKN